MLDPDGLDANVGSPREGQGVGDPGFVLRDSKTDRAIMPGFPIQRH